MNCRNCGAPMELFERRRYLFCTHCGSFSFIDTPEVEGVRVPERPVPAPVCPRCRAPLVKALLDDAYAVEHCERYPASAVGVRGGGHAPARKPVRRTGTAGADGSA